MCDERSSRLHLFRSALSGEPLTLRDTRLITVATDEIPARPQFRGRVQKADPDNTADTAAIEAINEFYWGSIEQDIFGRTYDVLECDNFLARPAPDEPDAGAPSTHGIAGHVALTVENNEFLHIVVFHVWPEWHGRGVGRALLNTAISEARTHGLSVIKLGTTNDNIPALYFYQRAGFVIEEVVVGEVATQHGDAPVGFAGIPVRDEIRLRMDLRAS